MFPVLIEIPDAFVLPGGVLAAEIAIGLACGLGWLALHLRGQKGALASTLNMVAFVVLLHLLLSWFMEGSEPITIYSFGVVIILGFFAGVAYMLRQTRPLGLEDKKIFDWGFWMLLSGIAGARVLYALLNYEQFAEDKLLLFKIWNGGLVWYGGLIPAAALGIYLLWKNKLPVLHVADIGAAAIMLALGIGRWACLLAGDDYGRPTEAWFGIRFYHPRALIKQPELVGVPLYPTQLMMSVNCLWIFWAVDLIRRRARFAGQAFGWMLILYAVTRTVLIEPFRGDFVERNPGYGRHIALELVFEKGDNTPAVVLERGTRVVGEDGRTGQLLSDVRMPEGTATASVYAISDTPARPRKDFFSERTRRRGPPPDWNVAKVSGLPEGVRVTSGTPDWYASHLPVPPGYVSTSQWISVFVVLGGVALLLLSRRLQVPGYAAAVAEARAAPAS